MPQIRATPDEILRKIEQNDDTQPGGKLKIFFGYAAGVGKTYAMLEAAHAALEQGVDVVAGYIEPHTRPQTLRLLDGLETLHTLNIPYKGITLHEFDLDTAISRHPQLILVDELAHTNAEGCRHLKRYQDIEELLKAGIDVYTTVNVQHLESLNDIVASITGVVVRERIPDRVFDSADQVELVDIEPKELIARLTEGKIYRPEQAQKALGHFFSTENLVALREIALRRAADRVNQRAAALQPSSDNGYYTEEHILVCLSSSPSNAKIIRTAARMAAAFKGRFTALFVETSAFSEMGEEDLTRLRANLKLAQQMGATIETVYGDDIAFQISEYSRLSRVSKIVIGRSNTKSRLHLVKQPFSERLASLSPNLDIYIIPDQSTPPFSPARRKKKASVLNWADLLWSVLLLSAATAMGYAFQALGFSEANIITIYILGVLGTAVITSSRLYSTVSALISVLVFNFFFTYPEFTLKAYDKGYPVTFLIMFLAAFLTGSLAAKIKKQAKQSAQTAYRTKVLLDTNQLLQRARGPEEIATATASQLLRLLNRDIVLYTAEDGLLSKPAVFLCDTPQNEENVYQSDNEQAVAQWVFKNNKHAGASTNTLHGAHCLYLAIRGAEGVYGVVGIAMEKEGLDTFENNLVLSMLGEFALALERWVLSKKKEEAAMQAQNEKLRANLLRSISHDLRTPLTSISGNAGVLLNNAQVLCEKKRTDLYQDIYDDSMWLINLVENLLSVTRIEDGTMHLNLETELVEEVVNEALRHLNRHSGEHHIRVEHQEEFLMARMDARLIIQVIINIVDNAVKYTPVGSEVVLTTKKSGSDALIEIADNGPGLPDEAKERVFDMFYTWNPGAADSRRGLGLGLALCKSIVSAHGGVITARDNPPHGTVFSFTLPLEEVKLHE